MKKIYKDRIDFKIKKLKDEKENNKKNKLTFSIYHIWVLLHSFILRIFLRINESLFLYFSIEPPFKISIG